MQTPPRLVLSGLSVRTKLYPCISTKLSGVEESRKISDKHIKLYLYVEKYAFNCVLKSCVQLYCLDSNGKQIRYSLLISLDLDLTQYLYGVVEEQKYTRRLIKEEEYF